MIKYTLPFLAACLLLAGCSKNISEGTRNNPAADFRLELLTEDLAGSSTKQVETALNMPGSAELNAVAEVKDNKVRIRLGGLKLNTVQPNVMATIVFNFTSKPAEIAGTYNFPADNSRVTVILGQFVSGNWVAKWPQSQGSLQVNYDAATGTWNGTLTSVQYEILPSSPFKAQRLDGRFNHVPLQ
jgi:hypothetical protein